MVIHLLTIMKAHPDNPATDTLVPRDEDLVEIADIRREVEEFSARHGLTVGYIGNEALDNTYFFERLVKRHVRLTDQAAKLRAWMHRYESRKIANRTRHDNDLGAA